MNTSKTLTAIAFTVSVLAAPGSGFAAEEKAEKVKPYPLDTCVVSGEKLGDMGEPFVLTHQGQEIKFCCKACVKDFKKNPAKYLAQVNEAAKKVKPYPLETCIVSGKAHDDGYVFVTQGQEVRLCCQNCYKKFTKDPQTYLKKIQAASK